jgi:hypothetical protein
MHTSLLYLEMVTFPFYRYILLINLYWFYCQACTADKITTLHYTENRNMKVICSKLDFVFTEKLVNKLNKGFDLN